MAALVTAPHCEVWLVKNHPTRFQVRFFKDGIQIREQVWRSQNKILDELKKANALQGPLIWPKQFGDKVILKASPNWYWE